MCKEKKRKVKEEGSMKEVCVCVCKGGGGGKEGKYAFLNTFNFNE